MPEESDTPIVGETVVCRVTKVLGYGAFVELVEYDDMKGFVHISQISSSWVKNIRNHVKEGQIRAAKVLSFNPEKQQIDLSLTKVSGQAQRRRIEEWKQLKRSKKLLELLANNEKKGFDDAWDAIAKPLLSEYDSLPAAFQEIALKGESAAKSIGERWRKPLVSLVQKNISVPEKSLKGHVEIHSLEPNGVELIKEALLKGEKAGHGFGVEIFYIKGGKYEIRVKAADFKEAEKRLNSVANAIVEEMKGKNGEVKFEAG
ncbi:MAG: translation initiation factor IF-2 subunit alpha [Candidatus Diapherotrites archaeon]|uniref:Translation initiation factor IF-2 subunit alpha n=1 Tax=Candidatus Iainarchaeum sp. TaxID=3101447 RepID=A0A938YNX1_9ARCH|nr:translation initiation factor IF-2 subunit alpha [Candidatus Diapherotrites archaeon]